MASPPKTEAFPSAFRTAPVQPDAAAQKPRPRRKNSSLGADPRGDTGATSLATMSLRQPPDPSPPLPPAERKSSPEKPHRERKRRKAKKLFNRWKRMSLRHTWVNPLAVVLLVLGGYYAAPGPQNPLHRAIFLSYADPPAAERTHTLPARLGAVTQYGKGPRDLAFFAFYTVVLSFTREFLMQCLIRPLAVACGIRARARQARFMEQFYTALYFAVFGPFGLFVMSRTPVWYFDTVGMYEGFPHRAHEAYLKAYYLLQASYWAQQGLVLLLQLEAPRKDFRELVLHHLVTLALIGLSYRFHFTYMGVAVYITHDISDFFLATSKLLNYLDSMFTGPYLAFFLGVWAYLRHYINLSILRSLLPVAVGATLNAYVPRALQPRAGFQTGEFASVGPYQLDWATQQYKCWISQAITFALLAVLQAVNVFWFALIIRILFRYVFRGVHKDERSDDEDEDAEEEEGPADAHADADAPSSAPRVAGKSYADAAAPDAAHPKPQLFVNGKPLTHVKLAEPPAPPPASGFESDRASGEAVRRKR